MGEYTYIEKSIIIVKRLFSLSWYERWKTAFRDIRDTSSCASRDCIFMPQQYFRISVFIFLQTGKNSAVKRYKFAQSRCEREKARRRRFHADWIQIAPLMLRHIGAPRDYPNICFNLQAQPGVSPRSHLDANKQVRFRLTSLFFISMYHLYFLMQYLQENK